ncbi:MAG: hypothetical protein WCD49_03410 [Candidatus Acidiferrales bacterium]
MPNYSLSVSRYAISALVAVTILLIALFPESARAQVSVTTERNDLSRTGANLDETTLNTSNVNVSQFGKLYSYTIDGSIYAQPLYVPNVVIPSQGTHNVVYVGTMNDVIYALDADSNAVNGGVLWKVDLRNPTAGVTAIPIANIVGSNSLNIVGTVGIESTPVIDLTSNTIYLVARTMEVSGSTTNYVARLHALDITTGNEKFGGPVVIQGSVPGTGQGSSGGTLTLSTFFQNQRSSLALVNGLVVFSFASHEDQYDWHGWVLSYNATTLQQTSIYCTTPNGQNGGAWMSGRAPVVDSSGNLYYATGNGDWDGVSSFGDSIIKLSTTGGVLTQTDYFTPDNYSMLQADDLDLGSSGPLLIPGTSFLITAGKTSEFFLLQSTNLGHEASGNSTTLQDFSLSGPIKGGPVFWNRTSGAGPTLYIWPADPNALQALQFTNSKFNTTPLSESTILNPTGFTDGTLSLSANGSKAGTGIVWASTGVADGTHGTVAGVLRAFDANNLTTELWDSQMNDARDDIGLWAKFSPATVANGKVYLASFSNLLNVFGLESFGLSATPQTQTVAAGSNTTFAVSTSAFNSFSGNISLSVTGLPTGVTASFSPSSVAAGSSSTLTITSATNTLTGDYTFDIVGTSGSLTNTVAVTVNVTGGASFALSASPSSQTVTPGGNAPYVVNLTVVSGFTAAVDLSVSGLPANATGSFNPTSVSAGGSSTLTITTASNTPTGNFTFTITGTSSSLINTTTAVLDVASASGSSNVISIDFVGEDVAMASTEVAGVVAEPNWNDANGASTSPLSLVNAGGAATTATVTWSSNNVWETPITDQPGNARMMKGYLDTSSNSTTTVTVAGLPASSGGYQVYVYADGDNGSASRTGIYTISGPGVTTSTISLTDLANTNFGGTFTLANNSTGNYVVFTVNATGFTLSATGGTASDGFPRAPINGIQIVPLTPVPSFAVSATPSSQTVSLGGSTSYSVSTSAMNGFTGSIGLNVSGLPTNATGTFSPTSVNVGGSSTLTITTASNTPPGSFTLTVTGTSGSLTATTSVTLNVAGPPSFAVSATPNSQTVNAGGGTSYSVSTSAVNGFTGTISLGVSGLPTNAKGTFNPTSVSVGGSSTLTVTTTSKTPTGSSTLTIKGTSGSVTNTTIATLNVTSSSGGSGNAISIDFVGEDVAMAPTEVAGVVAEPNWNNASGVSSSSPLALVDDTGTATTATATWSSNDVWETPITDQQGNARMMKGYLDTASNSTTTVTVAGLPASTGGYQVYVYADGDNGSATRTGIYTISGAGITTTTVDLTDAANTNFSGTFTQANNSAGNYVVFTINATGFDLSATGGTASDGFPRAPINGIQIVPINPTPNFALSATPGSQTLNPGGTTTYSVNTSATNGFTGSIALTVSGLPADATGTFSPTSVSVGSSSTLTITTASNTPPGSFPLTITGTSGSLSNTTATVLEVTAASSSGNPISIDFVGEDVAMASTEAAGVVVEPNWNDATGVSSTSPLALVDSTGAATTTTVTWSSNDLWETPITDQPGNARMMKGYLDTGSNTTSTVTVAGLPTHTAGYKVYVYADGDNGSATRTGIYTISGAGITTTTTDLIDAANTNFSGTFTQANNSAGNYVVFTINATGFTLSATDGTASDGFPRAPVNGIQIVPQ